MLRARRLLLVLLGFAGLASAQEVSLWYAQPATIRYGQETGQVVARRGSELLWN